MAYDLLVKKLTLLKKSYLSAAEIRAYCSVLRLDYYAAIGYLTRHKHLHRILKGIFYRPTIAERKLKTIPVTHVEALAEALRMKKVTHWYLGLETALMMHHLTHEFFTTDTIINDTIFRKHTVAVLGRKVRFIKVKRSLFRKGISRVGHAPCASVEKTVLDMVYLSKYRGLPDAEIEARIRPLLAPCSRAALVALSKDYNASTARFILSL